VFDSAGRDNFCSWDYISPGTGTGPQWSITLSINFAKFSLVYSEGVQFHYNLWTGNLSGTPAGTGTGIHKWFDPWPLFFSTQPGQLPTTCTDPPEVVVVTPAVFYEACDCICSEFPDGPWTWIQSTGPGTGSGVAWTGPFTQLNGRFQIRYTPDATLYYTQYYGSSQSNLCFWLAQANLGTVFVHIYLWKSSDGHWVFTFWNYFANWFVSYHAADLDPVSTVFSNPVWSGNVLGITQYAPAIITVDTPRGPISCTTACADYLINWGFLPSNTNLPDTLYLTVTGCPEINGSYTLVRDAFAGPNTWHSNLSSSLYWLFKAQAGSGGTDPGTSGYTGCNDFKLTLVDERHSQTYSNISNFPVDCSCGSGASPNWIFQNDLSIKNIIPFSQSVCQGITALQMVVTA
jgi:hypothetical protein